MYITWTEDAWTEYLYWQTKDKSIFRKINDLIKDILRTGYFGIGKPEPLKDNLSGLWSRRITDKHRLIYKIVDEYVYIYSCSGHYKTLTD